MRDFYADSTAMNSLSKRNVLRQFTTSQTITTTSPVCSRKAKMIMETWPASLFVVLLHTGDESAVCQRPNPKLHRPN